MKQTSNLLLYLALALLLLFAVFTVLVCTVDVQPIGPEGSRVGLATINGAAAAAIGFRPGWYRLTEWLGRIAVFAAGCMACLGLGQLLQRKRLRQIDRPLLLLGGLFAAVAVCYVVFEFAVVNYRPVVLEEGLEASYPSSHTMTVMAILLGIALALPRLLRRRSVPVRLLQALCVLLCALTVVGRLLSGVHWLTDIFAGALLAGGLLLLYAWALRRWSDHA